ncbi:OVARIAN TUMOR DOMAIN-containing deubiquitinating enzyme 7 isoform X2 [Malania oleifera]|uniref:OVARIAN TUMOR DOMAIN-containing deubiquitinating enzyme 7 isoform X2 n=1 Tax=Malania oleifera TaxID=397392 RepID=UPI0025AE1135|nr:OVARIAN TUMOR DOMAIN-containing deubiquitinating enzyme 7 isoform X2 [Malania oleifera]
MVQAKHQKSRPKKQPPIKKRGKQADISGFREQLDALGLQIIQVTADGNCFFRALADQLEGNEEEHEKFRSMVVQYILKNREMFEPFIEDDVPFDEYCQSMEKDGTWAGHMELQAASLVTHSNICVHRNMSPRWYIRNFSDRATRMVHLSYHDEEHYNSVRLKEDPCNGTARPIIIKADADISAASHQSKVTARKSEEGAGRNIIPAGSIKLVMAGSACESAEKAEEVLLQLDGDVDAAIEFLIAAQATEDYLVDKPELPCQTDTAYVDSESGNCKQQKEEVENDKYKQDCPSNSTIQNSDDCSSGQDNKKIPRNKICPCGSKKKYQACCGSAAGESSTKFIVHTNDSAKGKKRKQGKKGGPAKVAPSYGSDGGPPDMGALCI